MRARFRRSPFAREAVAQCEHARLDGFGAIPAIRFADFKQANIALPVIQIPIQAPKPWLHAGRTHHGSIFGQRIRDPRGRAFASRNTTSLASSTIGIVMIS